MLQLKRITKVYKTKKGVSQLALDEVELNFGDTGLYFIVGPSGCGKSTLMNIIGGMDSFTSGEFLIDGKSSAAFKPRDFDNYRNKKIGVVFQNFNLLKDLNIKDNIKLSMQLQNKKISDAEIAASIASVGLPGVEKRKPTQLSGGQQQRIAIARALIKNPEIILADEPTGNLDQINSVQIFDLLKQLAKDKLVIVVTHNLQLAKKYADTLIIMQDGKVKKIASRKEQAYAPQTSTNDALTSFGSKKNKGGKDKKAYLSFSKKMSFAFSILRKNWFKTVLLFIMFTFSITMAGIGITAGRYDKVKTTFDTYTGAKITNYYIGDDMRYALNKDGYEENRTEGSTSPFISTFLKKERQDELLSKINNEKLVPMYASDMFCGSSGDIEYFMPINDGIKTKLNYNLIMGALPQNEHEVALSDLAYKRLAFQYNNIDGEPIGLYLEFDGTRLAGICYEKNLTPYYDNYKVVGLIDTGLQKYKNLCEASYKLNDPNNAAEKQTYEYNLITSYNREVNSGKHSVAFFTPKFFESRYYNMQKTGVKIEQYIKGAAPNEPKSYYPTQLMSSYDYANMSTTFAELNKGKVLKDNIKFYSINGKDNTNLKDNEIICNFSSMMNICVKDTGNSSLFDAYDVYEDKPITKTKEEVCTELLGLITSQNGITYDTSLVHDWRNTQQIYRGAEKTKLKVVGFFVETEGLAYNGVFTTQPPKDVISIPLPKPNPGDPGGLPTAPPVEPGEKGVQYGNAFASDALCKNMTYNQGIASYMLAQPDLNDMRYVSGANYTIDLLYKGDLQIADVRATTLKQVSMWISLAFGLISLFLMANYFISTVRENQKQVGILRAMGASVNDTMSIFLLEGVFIAVVASALAIGFIFPMAYMLEGKINLAFLAPIFPSAQTMATASSHFAISLIKTLTVGWQELVGMAGISFTFATVFTIIPLSIMLNKKPVEMLRRK